MMDIKEITKIWKKTWYFIWESNSIWSWIANIILAFVLIKFIVYPCLGLILATSHPIVAVVSGSMEHDAGFDNWWESNKEFYNDYNIGKGDFLNYKLKNGFNKGDIIILKGSKPENINTGDIIVFRSFKQEPIIHRVIKKYKEDDNYYFQTKGDHNDDSMNFEKKISKDFIIGKAVLKIPLLGWVKIGFVELIKLFAGA